MQLASRDCDFVVAAFTKMIKFLHQLGLNLFRADVSIRGHGSHDMVACFAMRDMVKGLLSIELNRCSFHKSWEAVLAKLKGECEARLVLLQSLPSQAAFRGVVLVIRWASRTNNKWSSPTSSVELLTSSGWQQLKAPPLARLDSRKVGLLLDKLKWMWAPALRRRVAKLAQFLKEANRAVHDVSSIAKAWSRKLAASGSGLKVRGVKFIHMPGARPWVASRAVFKSMYKLM